MRALRLRGFRVQCSLVPSSRGRVRLITACCHVNEAKQLALESRDSHDARSLDFCPFNKSLSLSTSIHVAFHDFFRRQNGIDPESFEYSLRISLSFI